MVSNGGILDCRERGGGGQIFFDGHRHIYMRDICHVYIGPMSVIDCQSYFLRVNEVVIEGGSFNAVSGRTRSAVTLSSVNNAVIREWSCSNYNHGLNGGCLNMSTSTLQVFDSEFTSNRAERGGVVYMEGTTSSLTVERCSFRNNNGFNGGVFYAKGLALMSINNSTFSDNSAIFLGGAICNDYNRLGSGRFTISGSNFTNNRAHAGGAMYTNGGGPFTFVDNNFIANPAENGGALFLSHCSSWSSVTITNNLFANNVASHRCGAVLYENCGRLTVINSHFDNNSASGHPVYVNVRGGGAICFFLRVDNLFHGASIPGVAIGAELILSTFTNNFVNTDGGAVTVRGNYAYLVINQSNFFNNTAIGGGGGAIHYDVSFSGNISIVESDFSYNTALYCAIIDVDGLFHERINFTSSSFTYNRATAEVPEGDIICIRNATVFIVSSTLSHNSAAQHAGVFSIDGSIVTIVGSSFINNTAAGDGGVMYTYYCPTIYSIYGSNFSQNTAGDDGGSYLLGERMVRSESRIAFSQITMLLIEVGSLLLLLVQ